MALVPDKAHLLAVACAVLSAPLGCELIAGIGDRHLAGAGGDATSSSTARASSGNGAAGGGGSGSGTAGGGVGGGNGGGIDALGGAWPDSATVTCTDGDNFVACPGSSDPLFGQDGNYVLHPPSYSAAGSKLVSDDVTGLTWTTDVALEANWPAVATDCGALQRGGFDDFRAPTVLELTSLLDLGKSHPAIDVATFPGAGVFVWSSESYVEDDTQAWGVDFDVGALGHRDQTDNLGSRLCVRGALPAGELVAIDPHLVADPVTGLTWETETDPQMTYSWKDALFHCVNLSVGGHGDFRLPSAKEFLSVMTRSQMPPYVDEPLRSYVDLGVYWTSTVDPNSADTARSAIFLSGAISQASVADLNYAVMCVRTSRP